MLHLLTSHVSIILGTVVLVDVAPQNFFHSFFFNFYLSVHARYIRYVKTLDSPCVHDDDGVSNKETDFWKVACSDVTTAI